MSKSFKELITLVLITFQASTKWASAFDPASATLCIWSQSRETSEENFTEDTAEGTRYDLIIRWKDWNILRKKEEHKKEHFRFGLHKVVTHIWKICFVTCDLKVNFEVTTKSHFNLDSFCCSFKISDMVMIFWCLFCQIVI